MSHAILVVNSSTAPTIDGGEFDLALAALTNFKRVAISEQATSSLACLAVAPTRKLHDKRIARSPDGRIWIADLGVWLPHPAQPNCDASWLLQQYRTDGIEGLARRLQGQFGLLVVDLEANKVHVVTDRCGSLHLYWRRLESGWAVSTSAAVLALCGEPVLDPVAVHEFVGTGIIYEQRSLWRDVKKVAPASVLTFGGDEPESRQYWSFAEVETEKLGLAEAAEQTYHGLIEVLKAIPQEQQLPVSDLTGGYDSRLLLAGLLDAGRPFHTTVSGSTADHPDVIVAERIAQAFGLQHQHLLSARQPSVEAFDMALRMTDGEYDAFDYARILHTHRRLCEGHGISLNGSFGELARGYWWELLWPHLGERRPFDAGLVARKRFAAVAYDRSIFDGVGRMDLAGHMSEVVGRAIRSIADFPNTSQMDCVYFSLRMQRWQGRIASSTNQLWSACSPIGFSQALTPILEAKAETRFRSLLVRHLFARFAPRLARIPLEHGYPPAPATPFNLWRFTPLLSHYGGKVAEKVAGRLGLRRSNTGGPPPTMASRPEHAVLFQDSDLRAWLHAPMLAESAMFRRESLAAMLDPDGHAGGYLEQWRRLVTLEALLRTMADTGRRMASRDHAPTPSADMGRSHLA